MLPSLMLMWHGTLTKGASAAVTIESASPTDCPLCTILAKMSVVFAWSRPRIDSVNRLKLLSALISARLSSISVLSGAAYLLAASVVRLCHIRKVVPAAHRMSWPHGVIKRGSRLEPHSAPAEFAIEPRDDRNSRTPCRGGRVPHPVSR